MSRKSTPDLLGEIMGATDNESNKAIKPESNKAIKLVNHKTIKQESKKAIKPSPSHNENEPKEKATFNLPVSLIQQLEEVWMKLKRSGKDRRITKTLIIEIAVRKAIKDYEEHGDNSELFKML